MSSDKNRYARQIILPEIGEDGQRAIAQGRVLCVGAGGLGCPALQYLAAAGVGHIGIIDHDAVDESNLQRQILFTEDQIGLPKASAAKRKLEQLNSGVQITAYEEALTPSACEALLSNYDVIIDASDNFDTTFLINDAAYKYNVPWVYGSILGFNGQMAAFHPSADQPCYRCLFPEKPMQNILNCAEAGVIGALAGIIGSIQALEALKILVNNKMLAPSYGKLIQYNALQHEKRLTPITKDPKCSLCAETRNHVKLQGGLDKMSILTQKQAEITPQDTYAVLQQRQDIQLIDVREIDEWDAGHIDGADHCPLSLLLQGFRPDNLKKDAPIILYCKGGVRSMQALQILYSQGYSDIKSMSGGYDQWSQLSTEAKNVA